MTHKSLTLLVTIALIGALVVSVGCGGSKSLSGKSSRELFDTGKKHYDAGKYLKAIDHFQTIVYNYPGESIVDTAQYYLGLSYYGNEDYKLASVEFNRLIQNYPSSVYSSQAQFMKAACLYEAAPENPGLDQTDLREALGQLEDFVIDHPESEAIGDAQALIKEARTRLAQKLYDSGVVYQRIGAHKAAGIYFQKVIDEYTSTEYGALATYGLADSEFHLKNYGKARTLFSNFATVFPEHELAPKAIEMIAESAYRDAEKAVKAESRDQAELKLRTFLTDFPEHKLTGKAQKLLNELPPPSPDTAQVDEES